MDHLDVYYKVTRTMKKRIKGDTMKNKQSERSVEWITQALFDLMETSPFEKIKIVDIVKKAGIARLTFYRHFESKEEVITSYMDREFEKYFEELSKEPKMDIKKALCWCFEYWGKDAKIANLLVDSNLNSLIILSFSKYFRRILEYSDYSQEITKFEQNFLEGGLLLVLLEWTKDPKEYSPSDMAEIMVSLTEKIAVVTESSVQPE